MRFGRVKNILSIAQADIFPNANYRKNGCLFLVKAYLLLYQPQIMNSPDQIETVTNVIQVLYKTVEAIVLRFFWFPKNGELKPVKSRFLPKAPTHLLHG